MLDIATTATAAALLNNAVSAVDKVYNWWQASNSEPLASKVLRNDPESQVLKYVSTKDGSPERVVMTYDQLSKRLSEEDFRLIKSFDQRMNMAMVQWEQLNARLPLAAPEERVRIQANMEQMKKEDICKSLTAIVNFIDNNGIDLEDHYRSVRYICDNGR